MRICDIRGEPPDYVSWQIFLPELIAWKISFARDQNDAPAREAQFFEETKRMVDLAENNFA
jgi:hypothetical protein